MKTREEVEWLKENWKSDPCWDIETTEGFGEYYEELVEFRVNYEHELRMKRMVVIEDNARRWTCSSELAEVLDYFLRRIDTLEEKLINKGVL